MSSFPFSSVPMSEIEQLSPGTQADWLWHGYLCPGDVTLLTSQWKTGKTTLLAGLLRHLEQGGDFLGRPLRPGRALVVSEESRAQWSERLRSMPIAGHAELMARPFPSRPNIDEWNDLIDYAQRMRRLGKLDLFVVDPLASFLPGRCESDAATLLEMLQPLHRLAADGVAVLLLHHPRKKPSEEGQSARGSGALLGFVDIVLELNRFSKLQTDAWRRRLVALSRKPETPERLAYEWNRGTGIFTPVEDPYDRQFEENWATLHAILKRHKLAITHLELLKDWPIDQEKPSPASLYRWLNRAFDEKRLRREGLGTSRYPWSYRLENKEDKYHDRGELPPLRGILERDEE
ncbi:MAG: AAA family ATPase [Planctomycetes bacterium]|nr:AAA family ATPase [Planctomycetota bacterium]